MMKDPCKVNFRILPMNWTKEQFEHRHDFSRDDNSLSNLNIVNSGNYNIEQDGSATLIVQDIDFTQVKGSVSKLVTKIC